MPHAGVRVCVPVHKQVSCTGVLAQLVDEWHGLGEFYILCTSMAIPVASMFVFAVARPLQKAS